MKKLALVLMLMFITSIAAPFALAFTMPAYVTYTPHQVTARITNHYGYAISCTVHVEGYRNDGLTQFANVNLGLIPYGMTEYAYANVMPPFFFTGASGWADCW